MPEGKRSRSMSIICLRSGMMNPTPMIAPATQAAPTHHTLKSEPRISSTGTVKITPAVVVLMPDATVCTMLLSTIVPRLSNSFSVPQPRMAATVEPLVEKPSTRAA